MGLRARCRLPPHRIIVHSLLLQPSPLRCAQNPEPLLQGPLAGRPAWLIVSAQHEGQLAAV